MNYLVLFNDGRGFLGKPQAREIPHHYRRRLKVICRKKRVTLFDFSICTWHKRKLEVNNLRENLLLDVQNASRKPQT